MSLCGFKKTKTKNNLTFFFFLTKVHLQALHQTAVLHSAGQPLASLQYQLQVRVKLERPVLVGQDVCGRHISDGLNSVYQPAHIYGLRVEAPDAALKHRPLPIVCMLSLTDLHSWRHWKWKSWAKS